MYRAKSNDVASIFYSNSDECIFHIVLQEATTQSVFYTLYCTQQRKRLYCIAQCNNNDCIIWYDYGYHREDTTDHFCNMQTVNCKRRNNIIFLMLREAVILPGSDDSDSTIARRKDTTIIFLCCPSKDDRNKRC